MRPDKGGKEGSGRAFYARLALGALVWMAAGFLWQPAADLLAGWTRIVLNPGLLTTDFMAVGGTGAAFFNSGLMMLLSLLLCLMVDAPPSGAAVAAVLSVGGFSFFGKTPLNALPPVAGVLLFARLTQLSPKEVLTPALFSTAVAPLVGHAMLGMDLKWVAGVPLGVGLGMLAGFALVPVAKNTIQLHQGYNLYNTGLAAGLITTLLINLLRLFGGEVAGVRVLSAGGGLKLLAALAGLCAVLALGGYMRSGSRGRNYRALLKEPGTLPSDFVTRWGGPLTLLNMALLGLMAAVCALIMGVPINGPVIGSALMAVGFGSFGKHPRNTLPVLVGALMASALGVYPLDGASTFVVLMFSTTLAPIAGGFGPVAGVVGGALHVAVAHQLAGLQGGANLYNNGFAGGMVAAVLVPVLQALKNRSQEPSK